MELFLLTYYKEISMYLKEYKYLFQVINLKINIS